MSGNPDNGHYYALLRQQSNWDAARMEAETFTFLGVPGHLATITTEAEQSFLIQSKLHESPGGGWIGASDAEVEGEWRWVTGPEAGELFWQGGLDGTPAAYANWKVGAPNDNPGYGGQDYGRLEWDHWNDTQFNYQAGAVLEFSVPEPSSLALLVLGAAFGLRFRCSNRRVRRSFGTDGPQYD